MYIDISDFLSERNELFFTESGSVDYHEINGDINLLEDPKFDLSISKVDEDELYLELNIFFKYETNCDRCLKLVQIEDEVNHEAILVWKIPEFEEDEDELDIDYVKMDGNRFNLSELIRQLILLSVPMKTLCEEACKGICPQCGQDLNLGQCDCEDQSGDIRFAVLKDLKLD